MLQPASNPIRLQIVEDGKCCVVIELCRRVRLTDGGTAATGRLPASEGERFPCRAAREEAVPPTSSETPAAMEITNALDAGPTALGSDEDVLYGFEADLAHCWEGVHQFLLHMPLQSCPASGLRHVSRMPPLLWEVTHLMGPLRKDRLKRRMLVALWSARAGRFTRSTFREMGTNLVQKLLDQVPATAWTNYIDAFTMT